MSDDGRDIMQKIRSESLREAARRSSASSRTVIVEVDVASAQIGAAQAGSLAERPFSHKGRFRIATPGTDGGDVIAAVRKSLTDIIGFAAGRYLSTSNTFIVDVTGAQLMRLAALPTIRAIHPNGERHRS